MKYKLSRVPFSEWGNKAINKLAMLLQDIQLVEVRQV